MYNSLSQLFVPTVRVPVVVFGVEALNVDLEALHCRQQVCLHTGLDLHKSVLVLHHLKPQHTHSHLYRITTGFH